MLSQKETSAQKTVVAVHTEGASYLKSSDRRGDAYAQEDESVKRPPMMKIKEEAATLLEMMGTIMEIMSTLKMEEAIEGVFDFAKEKIMDAARYVILYPGVHRRFLEMLLKKSTLAAAIRARTSQRWDVIASFINQHSTGEANITARDVLNKAKALQHSDFSKNTLKTQANATAFENFEKSKKEVVTSSDITVNTEISSEIAGNSESKENQTNGNIPASTAGNTKSSKTALKAWTKEEQALLEQAIKTYPISTPDRWDRIAECIPNRSKKDCLRRVKELVELVNSKKEAQQLVK
ncbi:dnaJ homolog subfamily C member 2-like [Musca domestica]|uniref:DnaJ homolog subfamily C member 2-like n=1 Tax=Musca domestica TaxID=7370 RepID=A0ABM3VPN1_MUSDO|nr:dnaJ homolog subfamily C member 2-like [Musca domestica]